MKWSLPQENTVKINVDAAVDSVKGVVGLGLVLRLRNHEGCVLECRGHVFHSRCSALIAEALGLKEALSWIESMDHRDVIVELNSKTIVDSFYSYASDLSEFRVIIQDCQFVLVNL